ncbi:MAG: Trm112 family protein [Gammaproteobacteria bacterium]
MDRRLLEVVVCPCCRGKLEYREAPEGLACLHDRLFFPIHEDIPVLLVDEARPLDPN